MNNEWLTPAPFFKMVQKLRQFRNHFTQKFTLWQIFHQALGARRRKDSNAHSRE
jgi:hypothetical protein